MKQFTLQSLFLSVSFAAISIWLFFAFHPFGPLYAWILSVGVVAWVGCRLRNKWLTARSGLMLLAAILFGLPFIVMTGHPVPIHQLSQVTVGTSRGDVELLLGTPRSVSNSGGKERWHYSEPTWCIVTISFSEDGLVETIVHDH